MKYTYAYKTSDGKRHEAAMEVKSDDDLVAYWESLNDRLRNLGIKLIPLE